MFPNTYYNNHGAGAGHPPQNPNPNPYGTGGWDQFAQNILTQIIPGIVDRIIGGGSGSPGTGGTHPGPPQQQNLAAQIMPLATLAGAAFLGYKLLS